MSKGYAGKEWKRAKRRDRSEGPASEVRKVAVTPERAALAVLAVKRGVMATIGAMQPLSAISRAAMVASARKVER